MAKTFSQVTWKTLKKQRIYTENEGKNPHIFTILKYFYVSPSHTMQN